MFLVSSSAFEAFRVAWKWHPLLIHNTRGYKLWAKWCEKSTTSSPPFILRDSRERALPAACRLFSLAVIFTRARVWHALLSLRKNGGLLVVYARRYWVIITYMNLLHREQKNSIFNESGRNFNHFHVQIRKRYFLNKNNKKCKNWHHS